MPKLKPNHISVTDTEDAAIIAAAISDPDALPFTVAQWEALKPTLRTGRPKAEVTKERITIRRSRDLVTQFRATGEGWQTRMDLALRQYIAEHPITHRLLSLALYVLPLPGGDRKRRTACPFAQARRFVLKERENSVLVQLSVQFAPALVARDGVQRAGL